MENDLRATDRKSQGIQKMVTFEYPIIPDVRPEQLARFVKFELLLDHFVKIVINVSSMNYKHL